MEEEGKSKEEIEDQVSTAMHARLSDFKDQADSLTLEGVRRVLEKDLELKTFALDSHKKFIKQWMEKNFYGSDESSVAKSSEENPEEALQLETGEESLQSDVSKTPVEPNDLDSQISGINEENSSLDGKETTEKECKVTQVDELSEEIIKKAIKKRATYFREKSENITMSGVRRLLEEDLKLEKSTLDAYKALIKIQLDEVLYAEPKNGDRKSKIKKITPSTKTGKKNKVSVSASGESGSSENESHSDEEEVDEKQTKPKKRNSHELKSRDTKDLKRQKISAKGSKLSGSGQKKPTEMMSKRTGDTEDRANASEDDHSSSSLEESSKKPRDRPTPSVYGKKVEHLKSVIKACGMGVPPSVYKRAKSAPEHKREAFLIKELEGILEKEGLSSNPSEKEIKMVRKNKERAKELEGIDMSNIVSSSRRRTTFSFIPPKPQIPIESDEDEEEDDEVDTDDEKSGSGVSGEGSEEDAEEESD